MNGKQKRVREESFKTDIDKESISKAVRSQMEHGKYVVDDLYGDGHASEKIVERLKNFVPYKQKDFLMSVPSIQILEPDHYSDKALSIYKKLGRLILGDATTYEKTVKLL